MNQNKAGIAILLLGKARSNARDKTGIIFIIIRWSINRKLNKNQVYVLNKIFPKYIEQKLAEIK